jgi:hypothetical protein
MKWKQKNDLVFLWRKKGIVMEPIKSEIAQHVRTTYGPAIVELKDVDRCIAICIERFPDHIIYVRPDERETHFLCHYVHIEDLQACVSVRAEVEEWKQQSVFQLTRRVDGNLRGFVDVAKRYVRDAVARMELMKGVAGRGFYKKVRTFEEAKQDLVLNPKPRRPPPTLPPPVCRRHNDVHWEAERAKRRRVATKADTVYLWSPGGREQTDALQSRV